MFNLFSPLRLTSRRAAWLAVPFAFALGPGRVAAQSPGNPDPAFLFDPSQYIIARVSSLAVLPNGKFLVGGSITSNDYKYSALLRFYPDGTLDKSFDPGLNNAAASITLQADGKIVVGGDFRSPDGTIAPGAARLNIDGTTDTTFNTGTGVTTSITSGTYAGTVKVSAGQPDGKVLIGGAFDTVNGTAIKYLARFNADGSTDTGFQSPIPLARNNAYDGTYSIQTIVLQPDGKILVGGLLDDYPRGTPQADLGRPGVARLNADGTLDATFTVFHYGGDAIALQADGKILVGGAFQFTGNGKDYRNVVRLNADGSLDTAFTRSVPVDGGNVNAIVVQPDGRILIGGSFETVPGVGEHAERRQRVARLNPDGTTDLQFDPLGVVGESTNGNYKSVFTMALQADGKVLIGGDFGQYYRSRYTGLARLLGGGEPYTGKPPSPPVATGKAPDLMPSSPIGIKVKTGGDKTIIKAKFAVYNLGKKPAKNVEVSLYLSDDTTLDAATDTLLGSVNLTDRGYGKLEKVPGHTDFLPVKLKTTASTTGRYLMVVADPDNAILEKDESNNVNYSAPLP